MNLSTLVKTTSRGKKRLGQGHGSGRVKTSGRGTKGQKARNKNPLWFDGDNLPLFRRLPFLRGKERNKSFKEKAIILNVDKLNGLKKDTVVDLSLLIAEKLVVEKKAKRAGVKILGNGTLTVALTVKLPVSESARTKIEKAGGKVDTI